MEYLFIKNLHVLLVIASISFFIVRFYWSLTHTTILQNKVIKVLPHCIDTSLMLAGIYLLIAAQWSVFAHDWLMVKLCVLLLYIVCGYLALKSRFSNKQRILFACLALLSVAYMVSIAVFKEPFWLLNVT